jgi:hypothetical protein
VEVVNFETTRLVFLPLYTPPVDRHTNHINRLLAQIILFLAQPEPIRCQELSRGPNRAPGMATTITESTGSTSQPIIGIIGMGDVRPTSHPRIPRPDLSHTADILDGQDVRSSSK